MAGFKLTGTIGPKGQNKPKDVLLFTAMLAANGYAVKVSDKLGGDAKTALQKAQIKFGKLRRPTYLIEPDDKTFKGLLPAYQKQAKDLDKQKYVKINFAGGGTKEQWVTEAQYKTLKAKVVERVKKVAAAYRSQFLFHKKIVLQYDDILAARNGMMSAFTHAATMKVGGVKPPNATLMSKTETVVGDLFKAANKGDLNGVKAHMVNVDKLLPRFLEDVARFLKQLTGSAGSIANALKVTSTVAFGIVGAMAAPVILSAGAVSSAAAASVAVGGGVKVIESASNEIGRYTAGEKMSLSGSAWNIVMDGTVGALSGGVASKFPANWVDDAAKWMAPQVTKALGSKISSSVAAKIAKDYLINASKEGVQEVITQTIEVVGKSVKSGSPPTKKDAVDAFKAVAFKFVSAGLLKSTKRFEAKLAMAGKDALASKLLPEALERAGKNIEIPPIIRAKIIKNVTSKLLEDFTKSGFEKGIEAIASNKKPEDAAKIAAQAAMQDGNFKIKLDKMLQQELKKAKVDA